MQCSRSQKQYIGQQARNCSDSLWNDKFPDNFGSSRSLQGGWTRRHLRVPFNLNYSETLRRKYWKMNGNVIASLVCMSETAKFFYINFKILVAFPRVPLVWENLACEKISESLLQGKTWNLCLLRRDSLLETVLLISYAINNVKLLIKKLFGPSLEMEGTHGNSWVHIF